MEEQGYTVIDKKVFAGTSPPRARYFIAILILMAVTVFAALLWLNQVKRGMGITNLHQPVDWGVYLGNFIYWVGLAHSGTLISAIFFLGRARWRDSVSRATEAMTVIAIMIAGLFPLIHLGRFWVVYYLIPYPSQRQIWPNFISPLIWDVLAVSTYFTVSLIFFFVGMLPDLAMFRDECEVKLGMKHWKTRLYRLLSFGWTGAGGQWRHYNRSYLYFAALVTPLVISVHSVVSWDFAMSILTGWHSTLYAPYFVAGAIHSGLAMAFLLLVTMRRVLNLRDIISIDNLEMIAKTMLVTTGILAYSYLIDYLLAIYSGDKIEIQFNIWQGSGWVSPFYYSMFFFNVFVPLIFIFKWARRSAAVMVAVGILVNIGMWLERAEIVISALSHDYMPHNWSSYYPSLTEAGITIGAFCFFFFLYLIFSKTLPTVALSDVKARIGEQQLEKVTIEDMKDIGERRITKNESLLTASYNDPAGLVEGIRKMRAAGFLNMEYFSPIKLTKLEEALGFDTSPVRFWTFIGAVLGLIGGFALAIGTAEVNSLIVGGKHPISIIPYCIPGFEGLILIGALANLASFIWYARRYRRKKMPYERKWSRNSFGLIVACRPEYCEGLREKLAQTSPEEIHVIN